MNTLSLFGLFASLALFSCNTTPPDHTSSAQVVGQSETRVLRHPDWSKSATIYEVNVRQHTPEGTFAAFERDLPRLDSMGVDILWLMPIYPIGELNRKGGKGSYYSVKNYTAVNPEFGNMDDFRRLVKNAHNRGMKVILDWVANHTAWDHAWIAAHPEWYTKDSTGKIIAPVADWSDVADLNYDSKDMRRQMIEEMRFWIKEADVDGFRCDVAMMVPTDFWDDVRASLDSLKPVFMLAEAEQKDHHLKAFDMSYSWELMHIMNEIASGKKKLSDVDTYIAKQDTAFPRSAYRMNFTTNHDENTWNGTGGERLGKARFVFDVLAFTLPGMPLVYSGQEGGEAKENGEPHRYAFFEKDTIRFNGYPHGDFYGRMLRLHQTNPALFNGEFGGSFKRISTSTDESIYAFVRKKDERQVVVLLNFSDKPQKIDFTEDLDNIELKSIFNNQTLSLFAKGNVPLPPYGYQVFAK
jgi:glycosidase